MKNIKKALISMIAIIGLTTNVSAFEGFSVGAVYSSLDFSTTGEEVARGAEGGGALTLNKTTKSGSGDVGSIFGEYTFAQGSTIGVEHISGSTEIGTAQRVETGTTAGTVIASASISDPTTYYVEPTFMMNDTFGVYLKGGATHVSVEPKETDAGSVTASTYKSEDVWGIVTGVGAKYYYGNFFVKAEYLETEFETYKHTSTTGDKNTISADIDTEETRLAIGYNF
jgi:hypothetical protein|tara:strand:+ start:2299 stop:2976 length:678 start_codon:yes stop_codon:yes gene_type:complete